MPVMQSQCEVVQLKVELFRGKNKKKQFGGQSSVANRQLSVVSGQKKLKDWGPMQPLIKIIVGG